MDVYEKQYRLLSSDTDAGRRLRLSRLLTMLQEAAIAHTELLGAGRTKTLDRGILWVIATQQVRIRRLPEYDEEITLTSVPGDMMHVFFPRHYRISDAAGNELITASALWALMDQKTRAMVFPKNEEIGICGVKPDWETFMPRPPRLPSDPDERRFTVPYSYTDLNGHMNNTRYFDLAEDLMPADLRAKNARELSVEYTGEARLDEEIRLSFSADAEEFLLSGATDKRLFRLGIRYE